MDFKITLFVHSLIVISVLYCQINWAESGLKIYSCKFKCQLILLTMYCTSVRTKYKH